MDSRYVVRDEMGNVTKINRWRCRKCKDIAGPPQERGCAENDLNIDLISNLTKTTIYCRTVNY